MVIRFTVAIAVLVGLLTSGQAAERKVVVRAAESPDSLVASIREQLDKSAISLTEEGEEILAIWFRTVIPAKATAEQVKNGLTYREIPDGTLIGAVKFAKPFIDFRKQEIAAGVYTLRLAIQPDTGDHSGTAPHTEFVLLVPAKDAAGPDPLEPKTLYKLSLGATGEDHPGVMLLFPNNDKGTDPRLVDKENGVRVVTARRAVEVESGKTTLGFALTIAGHSKTR